VSKIKSEVRLRARTRLTLIAMALLLAACDDQSRPEVVDETLYAQGQRVFLRLCRGCHQVEMRRNTIGPHLVDLMGRRAGSVDGYDFSPAMREFDIEWDAESLYAFLLDPPTTVPGTKMVIEPVDDPDESAAVIYYLTQQ